MDIKYIPDPIAIQRLYRGLGFGMLNMGFYVQAQAQRGAPVRTGNLRRSLHAIGFVDGQVIGTNGPVPDYGPELEGIGTIVGTNCGYGIFPEVGTYKMVARPYLGPAFQDGLSRAQTLIAEGAKKHLG